MSPKMSMNIYPVTLPMMLDARERRQAIQNRLLNEHKAPLVCLTMNIAGDIKDTPAIRYAFLHGVSEIRSSLGAPVAYETLGGATGCEAFFVYLGDAADIKNRTVEIESSPVIGRLFDIDVLSPDGDKLSRGAERRCIVCGGPVTVCSRSRAHGLDRIREVTFSHLTDFIAPRLAGMACKALYDEVHLTPKPGLVDENNNGAHKDMDISMFERSAACLKPFFEKAVRLGVADDNCFWALNSLGLEAEREMLSVTGGINTHKGAIYSFLLLLGAAGTCLHRGGDILSCAGSLARSDTRPRSTDTHGSDIYARFGATGARGEAENGFPNALKACRVIRDGGAYKALLTLMADVADTNVLYRGGKDALAFMQSESRRILSGDPGSFENELLRLDREFIRRNLSPGGCADMLAMALFLSEIPQETGLLD